MRTKNLFSKEEREAVEDKYRDNLLYRAFATPSLKISNESNSFALSTADLFYQCFYIIDNLRGLDKDGREAYCQYTLRDELENHLKDKIDDDSGEDIDNAVSLIIQAVAEFFLRSSDNSYLATILILKERIKPDKSIIMDEHFRHGFKCVNNEEVQNYIIKYLQGDEYLSDDINDIIDVVEKEEDDLVNVVQSTIRIAPNKKSSVVLLLDAMQKSGWFVGVDNKKVNRDKAVNEILKFAFGEKKDTAIAQLLNPSGNIDNESRIRRIIEEIIGELQKYVK